MKLRSFLITLLCFVASTRSQSITWQTTHLGNSSFHSSGNCRLESNKIKITVHPFHLEVEEEAEIGTIGSVWSGDSLTLEIVGTFMLSKGSAIRSMLLWNGSKLLKAKLRDRVAADSAYEEVVDRDKPVYLPIDPALIECIGDNQYRFKIYPVAINKSRRIRIIYTIPLSNSGNTAQFEVITAFTRGALEYPQSIPVEINKSETAFDRYLISNGSERKPIHFGTTYLIPYDQMTDPYFWYVQSSKLIIIADGVKWNHSYSFKIDSGSTGGYYTAIYSVFPDTLKQIISETSIYNYTCDSKITTGDKSYITRLPVLGVFSIFLKSEKLWDGIITWYVYDEDGNDVAQFNQKLQIDSLLPECATLPLLWGAKYSFLEKGGDLGGLYGFVDRRMSLLALESDVLETNIAVQYADSGVPLLLPNEIIIDPSKIPVSPKENIIIDYTNVKAKLNQLSGMLIRLMAHNMILIEFGEGIGTNLKIELYDLSGRLVYSWKNISITGKNMQLKIPANFRGAYILKLRTGSYNQQQKLILR